jgi:hypothetical protein
LSLYCSIRSFHGERHRCMDVGLSFSDNHLRVGPNIHADVAALVDSAARTVHVGQAD